MKDFAGPIATVIAAIMAFFITLLFGLAQYRLARSQRDIAHEKLKFDLLKERYAIYETTKRLIEHIALVPDLKNSDTTKIREMKIKIDEARFYFPKNICDHLEKITAATELYLVHLGERENLVADNTGKWHAHAEILAADLEKLRKYYADLPVIFEQPLAFKQLTQDQ